jgi:serine O-acetyltransferase
MTDSKQQTPDEAKRSSPQCHVARAREAEPAARHLANVVDQLCTCGNGADQPVLRGPGYAALPARKVVVDVVEELRSVLFPGYFGSTDTTTENMRFHVGSALHGVIGALQEQVRRGLCFVCEAHYDGECHDCEPQAREITQTFIARLPRVQELLAGDALAAYEGDPAATAPDEAVFCYPGMLALTNYRLAHELHLLGVPLLPRMITEHAHSLTGIDIHPGCSIGPEMFIDHGTGVVMGETGEIGRRVRIYQGVTLGAKSFPLDEHGNPIKGIPRHPIVEDEVVIYAGATVLGRVRIGRGSVIGGNVWLMQDVPPGSIVTQSGIKTPNGELAPIADKK